jgi:hypothetical protein
VTAEETGKLLALCACFDFREVDETDIVAWHELLSDLEFPVARKAVMSYYRQSRERIMPSDIRGRCVRPEDEWKIVRR